MVYEFIIGDFLRLSKLKFSSNVIEKCLESEQSYNHIELLLKGEHKREDLTLINMIGFDSNPIERLQFIVEHLASDSFGNYVLQKILSVKIDAVVKTRMLEEIRNRQAVVGATVAGQKLLSKLRTQNPAIFNAASSVAQKQQKGQRNTKKAAG